MANRLLLSLVFAVLLCGQGMDLDREMEAARHSEMVTGDLQAAASQYQNIAAHAAGKRPIAAQALLASARCLEKLGRRSEARAAYLRVVNEYGDQKEIAGRAKAGLSALVSSPQAPQNLNFERGSSGWVTETGSPVEIHRTGCRASIGCASLVGPGRMKQSFSATPYRGRTVRLRGWLRVDATGLGDRAQLWLGVGRLNGQKKTLYEMSDGAVRSATWTACEIAGEIESDAQTIELGVASGGQGRVWIDGISFQVVPEAVISATHATVQKEYERLDLMYLRTEQAHRTAIVSLKLTGNGALVTARVEYTRWEASGTRSVSYVDTRLDTWVHATNWKLKEERLLTTREVESTTDAQTMKRAAADLRKTAAPLATIEVGHTMWDLAPFGIAVGDARVVALGEATFGTREFFEIKHRLLEYLIDEKGFSVFAINANFLEAIALDHYLNTGEGDPKALLAGMLFPWNTEDALQVIEWMRGINRDAGKHRPLRFTSFGIAPASIAIPRVVDYLRQFSPLDAVTAQTEYAPLLEMESRVAQVYGDNAMQAAEKAQEVVRLLDAKKEALIRASSELAWRDARQAAEMARQSATTRIAGQGSAYGNEMMARNVEWLLNDAYPGEKIVLWGHNALLGYSAGDREKSVGTWLRDEFHEQIYVAGFAFHRGEVLAMGLQNGKYEGVAKQMIPLAAEGSGDSVLSAAGMPVFFLDLRSVAAATPLGRWLVEPHSFLEVGALWNRDDPQSNAQVRSLARSYDGLVFLETGHAAREL